MLYNTVRGELETFLARAQASGRNVPVFVERELRAFLQCGILAHGFVHVRCAGCGHDRLIAFSCKGRGFCPSCGRRRMAEHAGRRLLRIGQLMDPEEAAFTPGPRCASVDGVSLHANVSVPARDRRRLEILCRYIARPPVSTQRLSRLDDGRLLYRLKRRWRDGTTHVMFEPIELVEKLVAIVPPPRCHLVRYHGVLAPRAHGRNEIVAETRRTASPSRSVRKGSFPSIPHASSRPTTEQIHRGTTKHSCASPDDPRASKGTREGRQWIPWAELMRRVFNLDLLECPTCKGPMRIMKVVLPPDATREILESVQLSPRAPRSS